MENLVNQLSLNNVRVDSLNISKSMTWTTSEQNWLTLVCVFM